MPGTKDELRSAIQQQLQNDGVLDEITARIRSRFLQSLLIEHGPTVSTLRDETNSQSVALLSLLYHFLEQNQFTHTLSVFAAESRLERFPPLSSIDAIKELGLHVIWDKFNRRNQFQTIDILSLLQGVTHVVSKVIETEVKLIDNSDRDEASKAVQTDAESMYPTQISKSIQTDVDWTPPACSVGAQESDSKKDDRSGYCNESLILAIEREYQQRMTQEMNEKLRLSAKTQAIQATRRLEQKHTEALQLLQHQIEVERCQSQVRQEELTEKLAQQQLEKSSLQNEMDLLNERVKDIQKQRFREWTDEHEMLERKVRNTIIQLDGEKRNLQTQLHFVEMQKEAMRAKETQLEALTEEKSVLLAEIADLRDQQSASLATQKRTQLEFQKQLTAIQERYTAAKADLHATKEEVAGLLALLRQSQKAIESLTYREIGALNVFSQPIDSRDTIRPVSQLGARAQPRPGATVVPLAHTSLGKPCEIGHVSSLPSPSILSDSKQTPKNHVQGNMALDQHKNQSSPRRILSGVTMCIHSAVDPPCFSSEDPPETDLQSDGRRGKTHHTNVVGNNQDHVNVDNSIDTIVGKEIVLDSSLITEHTQQEDLIASTSMPTTVQIALSVEATHPKASSLDQSSFDECEIVIAKEGAVENIASFTKTLTKSLLPNKNNENVQEDDVESDKDEDAPSEHNDHEAYISVCSSNKKAGPQSNCAQQTTTKDDSEEYSEHFQSFDEGICQPENFNASPNRPLRGGEDVSGNVSILGSPASASYDGYSESFCSLTKNET
jgi:hypothetical protein